MGNKKGSLSITSENIFPVIKKWLYSDHDIFYRELISNGCDAITKLKKLDMMGEYSLPLDYKAKIQVVVSPEDKTLTFIDNGLGMTADVKSNTTLNIGGELNADTVDITTNTNRLSTIDYSSSAGGGISITRISVDNKVNGESVINLDNYTPSKDYANKLTISHNSENTQDTVSSSVSGGALSISTASVGGELDSKKSLNIKYISMIFIIFINIF